MANISAEQARLDRARRAGQEPPAHGLASTYTNWGCRCEECRAANSARARAYNAARRSATSAVQQGSASEMVPLERVLLDELARHPKAPKPLNGPYAYLPSRSPAACLRAVGRELGVPFQAMVSDYDQPVEVTAALDRVVVYLHPPTQEKRTANIRNVSVRAGGVSWKCYSVRTWAAQD